MILTKEKKYENQILDLTNDIAFRRIFQDKKFKWYLSYVISYCTNIDIDYVYNNINYRSNNITSENISKKTGEADILVDIDNKIINLEMNQKVTSHLIRKNKYYVSALDSRNTDVSKNNKINNKYIIQINISTKERIPNTKTLLYEIVQMDKNLKVEDVYNNYTIYDINLDYLKNELYNKGKLNAKEKGLLLFIETNKEKLKELFRGDEKMNETVDNLDVLKFYKADEEFYESYDHEEFNRIVQEEALEIATEKATKEGFEKGMEKGMEKGIEQGIEQGISQRNVEIAKNLLSKNIDISIISNATGLSTKEIEKLK